MGFIDQDQCRQDLAEQFLGREQRNQVIFDPYHEDNDQSRQHILKHPKGLGRRPENDPADCAGKNGDPPKGWRRFVMCAAFVGWIVQHFCLRYLDNSRNSEIGQRKCCDEAQQDSEHGRI